MSELPEGWVECALGELGAWSSGGTPSRQNKSYYGGDIPWVKTSDLGDALLSDPEEFITQEGLKNSSAKLFPSGSLLIAMYGATIGKTAILERPAATNQACAVLLPEGATSELIPYVWRYVIASKEKLRELGKGGAQPNISQTVLKNFPISLPPKNEQRRIVEKVDSLLGRSTRARDELGHIPRLIERYKQAVLTKAFRGDLTADWRTQNPPEQTASELVEATPAPQQSRGGRDATETVTDGRAALSVNIPGREAPEGWAWVSLRRVARQETGHTPSRKHPEYWNGDIPWIGIADANEHHGGIIEDTHQHVAQAGLDNSSARLLPAGTVCLSRTASVGYVVRMGRDMATSQDFVTWTCSDALDPEYLMFALLAEGDDIRRFGKGSTHKTIYFPEVRAFHICLAPLEEQKEIVRRVKAALAWIDRIAQEHENAAHLLSNLDQAVLAKAFRGELVPQDPDDEPASVLLERIREERAKQTKAKRGRRKKKEATA